MSAAAPTLSAIAIMKNEADNLPGLLANLAGAVDELILVDDASSDGSPEIARAAGPWVRVIEHPMDPATGFSGQRNLGLEAATGDWIMHLDCDERASPELMAELRRAISARPSLNALRYRRLNYFLNRPMRGGGWTGWNRPQIARRGAHHFENALHERCVIAGGEAATGQLETPMHHLNDLSYAGRLAKSQKYVAMTAEEIGARGRPVRGRDLAWQPLREFLKRYIAMRGYRDGAPGFIWAMHTAMAAFQAHALVWDAQNARGRATLEAGFARKKEGS